MEIRTYKPISEKAGFFVFLKELFSDLPKANSLGFRLANRNIKAKYRQSIFGFFWAILPPLATSFIWIFLNSSKIIRMEFPEIPYPVFVFCGTIIWQVFASSVQSPLQAVSQNQSLLVKINFPREAIFIAGIYELLFNAAISTVLLLLFIFSSGILPDWTILFYIPILFILVLLGLTLGLFLLPIGVLFKDIQFGLPVALQFLMYLSPVVYVSSNIFGLAFLNDYNPLAYIINLMRNLLTGSSINELIIPALIISGITILLSIVGLVVQRISMSLLVERMGA